MILTASAFTLALLAPQAPPPPPPPPPPQRPVRDAGPVLKGTAVIKGHVRTVEGRPLRRAQIRLTGHGLGDGRTVTTGLDGDYEITELPSGRFDLQFSRAGYLTVQYGQRTLGDPGVPLEVLNGSTMEKVDATLVRGGVISGRVLDETGDPISGVQMWSFQHQFFRGRRRLVPIGGSMGHVTTDDAGQYRLIGLPPGDYVVAARMRDTWMSDDKEPQMLAYAPTYFPGTAQAAEARRIRIAAGQEVGAIDMTLVAMRAARVSGSAVAADGTPFNSGSVVLTLETRGPLGGMMSMAESARINPDGTWTLSDVSPGEYIVRAFGSAGERATESATVPLSVAGSDIEGLVIRADPGAHLAGTLMTDTGEPLPKGTSSGFTVLTTLLTMEGGVSRTTPGVDDGIVGADGRFRRRTPSGGVVVRVSGLPREWQVRHVMIDNRDYAGLPIDLRPGQELANATVVITRSLGTLTGRVLTDKTETTTDATVLLFPVDAAAWSEAAANQRTARPDQSGQYRFENLRPGEYFVVALPSMERWQMNDPEFLTEHRERATRVKLGAEALTADLKVVR